MATAFEQPQDFVRSDFGLKQMEGSDFGAFKSTRSHSTMTTTAETHMSSNAGSEFMTEEELRLKKERKKKKKEEKKKKKEKKKSKREKSIPEGGSTASFSTGSKSSNSGDQPHETTQQRSYSKDLFDKMLVDAGFNDDFGNEFDADPFQDSQQWDLEEESQDPKSKASSQEWGSASRGSGSRESSSRHSRASSSRQGSDHLGSISRHTRMTVASSIPVAPSTPAKSTTSSGKVRISLDFEEKPFESKCQDDEDAFQDGYDDDTVISDVSGLTGIFTDLKDAEEEALDAEPDEEPDMEAIMAHLKADMVEEQSTGGGLAPPGGLVTAMKKPRKKSCSSQPRRHVSMQSAVTATRPKPVQQLRFESVAIRSYERILTENPSTIQGPSIGVGWRFVQRPTQKLDTYEQIRGPLKSSAELVLNREQREELVLGLGYSKGDIATSVRNNNKVRSQRRQTVQNLHASKMEEKLEGTKKVVGKLLNPFGRKK